MIGLKGTGASRENTGGRCSAECDTKTIFF